MTISERPYVILVAMAFDETSGIALQEAARCAELRPKAELHIVHVLARDSAGIADGPVSLSAGLAGVPAELRRRVDMLRVDSALKITAHLRVGAAIDCILQTAADIDADLLILGSAKRRGLEKLMFGSVAASVLQQARCSVLVAAPKDHLHGTSNAGIEPPCQQCEQARGVSGGTRYWCERHSHSRMLMHVYTPADTHAEPIIR